MQNILDNIKMELNKVLDNIRIVKELHIKLFGQMDNLIKKVQLLQKVLKILNDGIFLFVTYFNILVWFYKVIILHWYKYKR